MRGGRLFSVDRFADGAADATRNIGKIPVTDVGTQFPGAGVFCRDKNMSEITSDVVFEILQISAKRLIVAKVVYLAFQGRDKCVARDQSVGDKKIPVW